MKGRAKSMAPVPDQKEKTGNKENPKENGVMNSHTTANPQVDTFDRYDAFKPFKSLEVSYLAPEAINNTTQGRRQEKSFPGADGDNGMWILQPERDYTENNHDKWKSTASKENRMMKAPQPHSVLATTLQGFPTKIMPQPVSTAGTSQMLRDAMNMKSGLSAAGSIEQLGLEPPQTTAWRETDPNSTEELAAPLRTHRPTAPKPRALKRSDASVVLQESSQSVGLHPVAGTGGLRELSGTATAPRDDISISPGVDPAWKESWVISPTVRLSSDKMMNLDDHTSMTDSMQMFANYRDPESVQREFERSSLKHQGSSGSFTKKEAYDHEKKLAVSEKISGSKDHLEQIEKPDRLRRGSQSSQNGRRGSLEDSRVRSQPKDIASSSSRGFVPVSPTSTDRDRLSGGKKLPMSKYCPWHPRPIYNTFFPQKTPLPKWLNDDSSSQYSGKVAKKMPSEKLSSFSEMPVCCQADESTSVKEITLPERKPQRKEVIRWLMGYPLHTRFFRETHDLKKNPIPGVVVEVDEENPRRLLVKIDGPADTSYENGVFLFEVFFPGLYPHEAPKLRFMTKIFHPNIDKLGRVRLPIIEEKWSQSILLRQVLQGVQELLAKPNLSDPMAVDVARRWFWHEPSAKQTARVWTKRFAHAHPTPAWLDCNCKCFCENQLPPCPM